jgi:hypothetical protein
VAVVIDSFVGLRVTLNDLFFTPSLKASYLIHNTSTLQKIISKLLTVC